METSLKDYKTDKFNCKKCSSNDMLPNKVGEYIRGFRCQICGEINYPTKPNRVFDIQELKKMDKDELIKLVEKLTEVN